MIQQSHGKPVDVSVKPSEVASLQAAFISKFWAQHIVSMISKQIPAFFVVVVFVAQFPLHIHGGPFKKAVSLKLHV